MLKNIKQSTQEETATWKYATYRVKNAGYTKTLYIQEVFLTNSNEIRNLYCKKKKKTNKNKNKWSQWETHKTWIYIITVLTWQKQTVHIKNSYTHHM